MDIDLVKAAFVAWIVINYSIRESPRIDCCLRCSECEAINVIHYIPGELSRRCSKGKMQLQRSARTLVHVAILTETPVVAVERLGAATAVSGRD